MIGDNVEIEADNSGHGSIINISERQSSLIRPPVANIDTLIIVSSAKNPDPDFLLIDKLIIMAEARNITPVICVTKTDLEDSDKIRSVYKNTGYRIFDVCSVTNTGIEEIRKFVKNKTTAFAGLSGVGKSSLLNLLVDDNLETGDISKINRGKHTTRHVELFELKDGGYVLDTPGFSSFETEILKPVELSGYYPEMLPFNDQCRFKGCSHINEPDCAVKNALADGIISPQRYENYSSIYQTLKQIKDWEL